MRNIAIILLLVMSAAVTFAAEVRVDYKVDGKPIPLTPVLQGKLATESLRLLATCTNVMFLPHRRLRDADSPSSLHLVFVQPQPFDLGPERITGRTNVLVKELLIGLPLSSGGAWFESPAGGAWAGAPASWGFCSQYDRRVRQEMEALLKTAHSP